MKRYDIFLGDGSYSVYPAGFNPRTEKRQMPGTVGIYITPTGSSDLAVSVSAREGRAVEMWELRAVLSYFLGRVRGYPKTELEVGLSDRSFNVGIFDTPQGYAPVDTEKCKLLVTSDVSLPDGVERRVHTAHVGGGCRILPIDSCESFDRELLRTLLVLRGHSDVRTAFGLCGGELILREQDRLTPYMLSAAYALFEGAPALSCRGVSYPLIDAGEGLLVLFPCRHTEVEI